MCVKRTEIVHDQNVLVKIWKNLWRRKKLNMCENVLFKELKTSVEKKEIEKVWKCSLWRKDLYKKEEMKQSMDGMCENVLCNVEKICAQERN